MADLTQLSDEQLLGMLSQGAPTPTPTPQAGGGSLQDLSDEQLMQMLNNAPKQKESWNIGGAAKQFASGAVEGMGGLVGLGADLVAGANPYATDFTVDEETGMPRKTSLTDFKYSKKIQAALEPYLSEKDPEYRYSRIIGSFAGPGVAAKGATAIPGLAKAAGPAITSTLNSVGSGRSLISAITGGAGAQVAEDVTGDKYIAPIVGAVAGGAVPELVRGAGASILRGLRAPTQAEIRGSAGEVFRNTTGLTADEVTQAIGKAGDDAFTPFRTTAEVTRNAGVAQMEKQLTKTGPGAIEYTRLGDKRAALRDSTLEQLPKGARVNPDATNRALRDTAVRTREGMKAEARDLWNRLPKDDLIDATVQQANVAAWTKELRGAGSLGVDSKLKTLVKNFTTVAEPDVKYLLNIRKDAGYLSKKFYEVGNEQQGALADILVDSIDEALKNGLTDDALDVFNAALASTGKRKQVFGRTTAGGALVNQNARIANLTKLALQGGDAQAAKELRSSIGNDLELIEQVNSIVLGSIKRDAQGRLTPAATKKFVESQETMLRDLLGEERFSVLSKVSEDLASEASVTDIAFRASRGNSITSQSNSVAGALRDVMLEGMVPGGGIAGRVFEELQKIAATKSKEQIEEWLLKAALDPKMARELLLAPTKERVMSVAQRFVQTLKDTAAAGGARGVQEVARPQFNDAGVQVSKEVERRQQLKGSSLLPKNQENLKNIPSPNSEAIPQSSKGPKNVRDISHITSKLSPMIQAVIAVESAGNPNARSSAGARGLMQVMPEHYKRLKITDPEDPMQSINAGTTILQEELDRFGDVKLALSAYNAGSPKVIKAIAKAGSNDFNRIYPYLPKETQAYVSKVLAQFQRLSTSQES